MAQISLDDLKMPHNQQKAWSTGRISITEFRNPCSLKRDINKVICIFEYSSDQILFWSANACTVLAVQYCDYKRCKDIVKAMNTNHSRNSRASMCNNDR